MQAQTFPSLPPLADVNVVIRQFGNAEAIIMSVFAEAMEQPSELSPGLREVIATFTPALNHCQFCKCSHARAVLAHGMLPQMVHAARSGDMSLVEADLLPIFDLAHLTALHPSQTTRADVEAVMSAGWSEQTAFDVLFVVSAFSLINRAASFAGLYLSEAKGSQTGAFIAKNGYSAAARQVKDSRKS